MSIGQSIASKLFGLNTYSSFVLGNENRVLIGTTTISKILRACNGEREGAIKIIL